MANADDILDVVIVGAGLSGIGAAFHLRDKNPECRYAILEGRAAMGGTWDLFRYPGVRSDSDMHTLGYSFRPWSDSRAIADGPSILRYIKETAAEYDIERYIHYSQKLVAAEWSSRDAAWTLSIERADSGEKLTQRCRFLILASGYYDFDRGYTPDYPGLADFRGEFVHPQKWGDGVSYAGKRVVVIGSGATAVTLVPELAKTAKHVTMLQRSPSYYASLPSVDHVATALKKIFPYRLGHTLVRWKNILLAMALFWFCRFFPRAARRLLLFGVKRELKDESASLDDFSPRYDPWDQRLCFVPDGDFFRALNGGTAEVVTDTVDTFTASGLRLKSGRTLDADLVVTATGLKLKFLGGVTLRIDGLAVNIPDVIPYKGAMLSGVPNLGMTFGYTNASWTLKCDLISEWFGKLWQYMGANGYATVTPDANPDVERVPLIDFSSGYFQRAQDILPRQGTKPPWKLSQNYFADLIAFRARPLADTGLRFSKR